MTEKEKYQESLDEFMNILLQIPPPSAVEVDYLRQVLRQRGLTDKQLSQIEGVCKASGMTIPDAETDRETIIIVADKKLDKFCPEVRLKDVLNQLSELIYGKKFNDGMHGAFGQAQNVRLEPRGKCIILRLPKVYENFDTRIDFKGFACCQICVAAEMEASRNRVKVLIRKMKNSIRHVEQYDVRVKIEYV